MIEAPSHSRAWRRFRRSRSAWIGASLVGLFVFAAIAAEFVAPYAPQGAEGRSGAALARPSADHWLGTDLDEYDVFSRMVHGSRLSLLAGIVSVSIAIAIGGPAGAVAGYFGGWTDTLVMRAIDVLLTFPGILVAMLVVVSIGPSWEGVMLAVGLINIPVFCRQVRATVLTVRNLEYVDAARAVGASTPYILTRVIFPSLINPIVVLGTLGLGTAILEVAGLSFLGVAGEMDAAEWGSMLSEAKDHLSTTIWPAVAPGIAISLTVVGFNLLGDGLRDALDPKLKRS